MAWFNLGWLQVIWFVVVVYAVTAAVVHLCLRRLIRRRAAADAEACGIQLPSTRQRAWSARSLGERLAEVRAAVGRLRRRLSAGDASVVVLPRPNVQVPQIAARPTRPVPLGGLSEGTPTMAITLLPRQRMIDLATVERSVADRDRAVDGPVHWWNATRR